MKCTEALELILEADRSDLRGEGSGGLAEHLRDCPKCQALAQTVLDEEAALATGVIEAVPPLNLDEILDRARVPHAPGRSLGRFKRAGYSLIPLAAAAAAAWLFLGREAPLPGTSYSPRDQVSGLALEVPDGRNAAVLQTDNPDITILWFF